MGRRHRGRWIMGYRSLNMKYKVNQGELHRGGRGITHRTVRVRLRWQRQCTMRLICLMPNGSESTPGQKRVVEVHYIFSAA